jgi:trigger factor
MKMTTFDLRSDTTHHRVFIRIGADAVSGAMEDAARGLQAVMALPPHPKGQVPLDIIMKRFGSQFRSGVTEKLIMKATGEAIYSLGLRTGADPQLDEAYRVRPDKKWLGVFADDGCLEFSVSWPRPATVELKDYFGITVEVDEGDRDAAITNQLRVLQLKTSSNRPVEREVTPEDVVVVDLVGSDTDGNEIHGARFNDFVFRPKMKGGRQISDKLNQVVIGTKAGDQVTFEETYDDKHHDRYLRGQKVNFTCIIKEVCESVVPEIDEEFAKTAGYDSLDALREKIGQEWDRGNAANVRQQKRTQVRKKVVAANPLPVDEAELLRFCESAAQQFGVKYSDLLLQPEAAKLAESIREEQTEVLIYNDILDRVFDLHAGELLLKEEDILKYAASDAQPGVAPEQELQAKKSKPAVYAAWLQRSQRQKVADWLYDSAVIVKRAAAEETSSAE